MRRSFSKDNVNFQIPEWFLATLTEEGTQASGECVGTPYAWEMLDYCANGQGTQILGDADNFGTTTLRPAYPIDPTVTVTIPSTVLMRLRGTFNGETIYEFFNGNGGATPAPGATTCFGVKSLQCNSGRLLVTMADSGGCANCTSGVAFYTLGQTTVSTATQTPVPNNWTLIMGDLTDTGLTIDGDTFKNTFGAQITLKLTLQYYWSPLSVVNQTRSCYVVRNGSTSDIPVANFAASNQTYVTQGASNIIVLQNDEYFQPYAYQDSGADAYIGFAGASVPTTLLIERLCT